MEKRNLIENAAYGANHLRALIYTLESLPLPVMNYFLGGGDFKPPSMEQQRHLMEQARILLEEDSRDIADKIYPLQVLLPETPLKHIPRWLEIIGDSTSGILRRRNRKTTEFSKKVNLENFPSYYQRNFHHQTDGYLSDQSARLYEHQVELLFRGLAGPMRRRLLRPLVEKLKNKKQPRILEIGCGSGSFTRFLSQALPEAKITAIDISPNYIGYAKKRFIGNQNVDFMVADAEKLPFKDECFDGVVSVYLHHELPAKVRENVISESLRVCTKSGFWGLVDSIQLNDDEKLNWAIQDFPKMFHEPFFTNYIKTPLLPWLKKKHPRRRFKESVHLLSKVVHSA